MDLDRLGRVEMHDLHEPARRVGADRNGDVETAELRADVGEVLGVAGVASEEERVPGAGSPSRPTTGSRRASVRFDQCWTGTKSIVRPAKFADSPNPFPRRQ